MQLDGLDIVFGGNTAKISLTDNLADALNITEGSNSYLKFVTLNLLIQVKVLFSVKIQILDLFNSRLSKRHRYIRC